jgi:hypothetical protein
MHPAAQGVMGPMNPLDHHLEHRVIFKQYVCHATLGKVLLLQKTML